MNTQQEKAHLLKNLHQKDKLLVLPNVWDVMSTRILANLGYPAIATASAAIAFSRGYDDGQQIPFDEMLATIKEVASSTHLPVTADFERGYARSLDGLKVNIRRLIDTGVVGLNIEDSLVEGEDLRTIEDQATRIETIRSVADTEAVPLVINARCDVFLQDDQTNLEENAEEAILRGKAYAAAGADCFYPILLQDNHLLKLICSEVGLPVNVLAMDSTPSQEELLKMGVQRLSLGPGWLKAAVTELTSIAGELLEGGNCHRFTQSNLTSKQVRDLLSRE